MKKEANFFFRGNCAVAVTHQYHQRILQESASKSEFVTFAVKDILLGFMATKPGIKIEQIMPMSLFFFFFYRYIITHTFKNIKTLSPVTYILEVPGKNQKEIPN